MNYSRQREAIRMNLCSRYDHPTAETVYNDLKESMPQLSLGTVYRNLALLTEAGEIQKLASGIGPDRFDGNPMPHFHFFCTKCGEVTDLRSTAPIRWTDYLSDFNGTIETESVQFYGVCSRCQENK